MKRLALVAFSFVVILGFGWGAMAAMQDSGTPPAAEIECPTPDATPGADATPGVATPVGATPEADDPYLPTGDEEEEIVVEMVDIAFVQNEITIPADTDVAFLFVNEGHMQHDFKIDDPEVYSGMLNADQESEVVVNLPAGEYEFYCTVPGHKEAGMVGTLIVEDN